MYDGMYKLKAANVQRISNTRPSIWQWILTLKKKDIWNHTIGDQKIEKTSKTHTIWTRWDETRYAWTLIHSTARYETIQLSLESAPHFSARSQNCKWRLLSFVMSVCLSLCLSEWNNSAPTGRIFMKFYIWDLFRYLSRKFKFH